MRVKFVFVLDERVVHFDSFPCSCPVFPAPCIEETVFPPLCILASFVEALISAILSMVYLLCDLLSVDPVWAVCASWTEMSDSSHRLRSFQLLIVCRCVFSTLYLSVLLLGPPHMRMLVPVMLHEVSEAVLISFFETLFVY